MTQSGPFAQPGQGHYCRNLPIQQGKSVFVCPLRRGFIQNLRSLEQFAMHIQFDLPNRQLPSYYQAALGIFYCFRIGQKPRRILQRL